jgi:YD repeat-containing protein
MTGKVLLETSAVGSTTAQGGVGDSAKVVETGAGSHAYGYSGGRLVTDDWTLNGKVMRKTFTYDGSGNLTAVSDWVVQ